MPKDFTGVERRSCNNEDVVYRAFELLFNVLIIFVIDHFQEVGSIRSNFYLLKSQPILSFILHPTG